MSVPQPLVVIDLDPLKKIVQEYLELLESDSNNSDNRSDFEHYIFKEVLETLYGDDIWNWINGRIQ